MRPTPCTALRASCRIYLEQVRPERIGVAFDLSTRARNLVPQRHLSAVQSQPRGAARRSGAAIRAVPRVLPAHGGRRVRERDVRSRRHHRNPGCAFACRRSAQRIGDPRQGFVAAHPRRRRVLGLQRQHSISLPRHRAAFRRDAGAHRGFSGADRRQRGQYSRGARGRARRPRPNCLRCSARSTNCMPISTAYPR